MWTFPGAGVFLGPFQPGVFPMTDDTISASHILLMYDGSANSTAARSQDEAQELIADLEVQLSAGGDFAELAREHSDCPSSRQGGDLGEFGRGAMIAEFEDAAFSLDVGKSSRIVETEYGYHLIQRTE